VSAARRDEWTEPGAYQVAPGVHRIPLPLPTDGLRAVNVYTVADGDELTLIDSGWAITEARGVLERALGQLGYALGDVRRFLITHVHRDHYTQDVLLRREFGARIEMGKNEEPNLDLAARRIEPEGDPFTLRLRTADAGPLIERLAAIERPDPDRSIWERPDGWLTDGVSTVVGERELRAIETPGHTRGHLVFRDDAGGLLFAGDHVLPHITPSIGFESVTAPSDFPLRDYLDSLRLVRALPDSRLLPAHGPVAESVHARVDELLEHHDRRLAETLRLVEQGAGTGYEVAGLLRWTRREHQLADLDPFNAMLAVLETTSHLDVLTLQGRAKRELDGEVWHYSA
jgi:glyoxylase-like metal-dependent hydrolase (beta-lactamase superfamily II)